MRPTTSSRVSPMPRMMPDFVVQPGGGRSCEHGQAAGVGGRGADGPLQAVDSLEVVVQHVGTGVEDDAEGRLVALAVGDEHLDGRARAAPADRRDRLGEGGRPAVGEVVAGHGRHDRVRQAHTLDRLGHATGLVGVERRADGSCRRDRTRTPSCSARR